MPAPTPGKIFVGVGGWDYAPWRDTFYPKTVTKAQQLHYASRQLTSTEINSTFYRLQKPDTFQKWHDDTPDDFVFSLKAPRFVTNRNLLATAGSSIEKFLDSGIVKLGAKLGAINWQLAPEKQCDLDDLAAFLELLPVKLDGRPLRHAVELRNDSFATDAVTELARKYQVAIIEAGDSAYPHIDAHTAPFSYLRVMGSKADAPKGYTPAALARWRKHAQELAEHGDVYFYFISGAKERNPLAALALLESLESRSG
jgi:uncharacterized protein YecE (DUF72 family)